MVVILFRKPSADPPVESAVPPLPARHHQTNDASAGSGVDSRVVGLIDQHVRELIAEGFDTHRATRALQLARNDLELARSILQEFATR
jgi:hypothetical protein